MTCPTLNGLGTYPTRPMERLRIEEAMRRHNDRRKLESPKMTYERLRKAVFDKDDGIKKATQINYLSKWNNGLGLTTCSLRHIKRLRDTLGTTYDELISA